MEIMEEQIAPFLSCVLQGITVYVSAMPMAGLSAPYSIPRPLPLTHAEALIGTPLAQAVNPGSTVFHAGLPVVAKIQKNYAADLKRVAHNVANLLQDKTCESLNLPSVHSACGTNDERPNKRVEADGA